MSWSVHPRSWGIITKVPLAVAALMILVAIVLSEVVLAHLTETQERHLRDLVQTYLDGLSSAITPSILREDTWEIFDAIERAQELNKGLHPLEAIVTDARGMVIAASDPRRNPVGTIIRVSSDDYDRTGHVHFDADTDTAGASKELGYPGRTIGVIRATFNTRHLATERHEVVLALVATNGALALVLAAAGWLLVARLLRPFKSSHNTWARRAKAQLL